uniref:Uncharacterized protein n=1 Tax=Erpetoichthys calabaricus TaxID=27687 RepID=A0A8C4S721_ERPCA
MRLSYFLTPFTASIPFLCSTLFHVFLSYTYTSLQLLQLFFATFHGNLLCFIQPVLQIFNGLFHVLLHTFQVGTGVLFLFQLFSVSGLQQPVCLPDSRIHNPLVVPFCLFHLLILLRKLSFNIGLNLVKFKLSAEDLAFLMF